METQRLKTGEGRGAKTNAGSLLLVLKSIYSMAE